MKLLKDLSKKAVNLAEMIFVTVISAWIVLLAFPLVNDIP